MTGASYGSTLAWAVVLSVVATTVLQEMTGRLGRATRLSLGEALRVVFESTIARAVMVVLVVAAIGIGGASYAGGDTTGTALALIGTTVVPYNLFLQSSPVQEKWGRDLDPGAAMKESSTDTVVSISAGGLITLVVRATAFGAMYLRGVSAETGQDLIRALEPLLGPAAPWVFAVGLFAAGLTSAVAGPLGAAYAISGTIGRSTDLRSTPARIIWISVLLIGGAIALTGFNPVQIMVVAQAANGLLLPIVASFLMVVMVVMDDSRLMGRHRNGPVATVLGGIICLVVTGPADYQLTDLFGLRG